MRGGPPPEKPGQKRGPHERRKDDQNGVEEHAGQERADDRAHESRKPWHPGRGCCEETPDLDAEPGAGQKSRDDHGDPLQNEGQNDPEEAGAEPDKQRRQPGLALRQARRDREADDEPDPADEEPLEPLPEGEEQYADDRGHLFHSAQPTCCRPGCSWTKRDRLVGVPTAGRRTA